MLSGYYETLITFIILVVAAITFLILMHTKRFSFMNTTFEKAGWLFTLIGSAVVVVLLVISGVIHPEWFEALK